MKLDFIKTVARKNIIIFVTTLFLITGIITVLMMNFSQDGAKQTPGTGDHNQSGGNKSDTGESTNNNTPQSSGENEINNDNEFIITAKSTSEGLGGNTQIETVLFELDKFKSGTLSAEANEEYIISLCNNTDSKIEIEIFEGENNYTSQIEKNKTQTISITAKETGDIIFSYIIKTDYNKYYLPSNKKDFDEFLTRLGQAESEYPYIRLLGNIQCDDLTMNVPFTLDCGEYSFNVKNEFIIHSDSVGKMHINNSIGTFKAGDIYIFAPKWDVTMAVLPDSLVSSGDDTIRAYYANVSTLNGRNIDGSKIKVDSVEKWERLCDKAKYPKLQSGMTVEFTGKFNLSNDIKSNKVYEVDKPVSLVFGDNINFTGGEKFNFITMEKGSIKIKTGEKYKSGAIYIDAPYCDVTWDGNGKLEPEKFFMEMNASIYNGNKSSLGLGGPGRDSIVSMSLTKGNNKGLNADFIYSVSGNVIKANYGYSTPESILSKAKVDIKSSGGKVEFSAESKNANGTVNLLKNTVKCTVTDSKGQTRTYLVVTEKNKYYIPVINITTQKGRSITARDEYTEGTFSIEYPDGSKFENLKLQPMGIKGRGHSSWLWPKKPYKVKFDSKVSLFGKEAAKDWVMLANYSDKSLMRNHVAFTMAKQLSNLSFVPSSELVDVFVNGEYQGVYSIGEQLETKDGRVEVDISDDVDTGYLLEIGGSETGDVLNKDYFHAGKLKFVLIRGPVADVRTKEQFNYIKDYMTKANEAVVNLKGYEEYIDIPSLIDWFIHHELVYNLDSSFRRSCYMVKDKGGKLKMGPPWDMDLAFGNFSRDNSKYDNWACMGKDEENAYVKVTWMNYLLTDPAFNAQLKKRWAEVSGKLYDTAIKAIDDCAKIIEPSQKENFITWNIMGKKAGYEPSRVANLKTYKEQLDYMKNFLKNRKAWMDKTIKALK